MLRRDACPNLEESKIKRAVESGFSAASLEGASKGPFGEW